MAAKKLSSLAYVLPEIEPVAGVNQPRGIPAERQKERDVMRGTLHSLSHKEIDRRIDCLTREVATGRGAGGTDDAGPGMPSPRWIAAAELIDRMRPFLVYN